MLTLSDFDNGGTITIEVDKDFEIKLEENATTGFQWSLLAFDTSVAILVNDEYNLGNEAIGAAGIRRFLFKTTGKGTTSLKFSYNQPWTNDDPNQKMFSINIIVQ